MRSITMNDGNKIPRLGYGVFQMTSDEVRACLPRAIEAGYRHIDTAISIPPTCISTSAPWAK